MARRRRTRTRRVSLVRSRAARKAWETRRRRRSWKGICPVCRKPVWMRGRKYKGRYYHERCLEARLYAKTLKRHDLLD